MKLFSLILLSIISLNSELSMADYGIEAPEPVSIELPEMDAPVIDLSDMMTRVFSLEFYWNKEREKVLKLTCGMNSMRPCLLACGSHDECIFPEGICYNCIGNDLFIVNFYKNLGLTVNTTGKKLPDSALYRLLNSNNFITLKANSVYNIISDYDSRSMKRKFKNLCPAETKEDAIVFAEVDRNRKPFDVSFVLCDKDVYEMTVDSSFYNTEIMLSNDLN